MPSKGSYYVYIVANQGRMIYVGVTNDLRRRIAQHREGTFPGFTSRYNLHLLVYFEYFRDINKAIAREKQIKGWRREKKLKLIEKDNAGWLDLYNTIS